MCVLRENEGFLHSKLHHGEYEKRKAEAHNGAAASSSVTDKSVVSKSVETMKPHPNPLLTAKVAPPINPALLLKPVSVAKSAEVAKPVVADNTPDNPPVAASEAIKPAAPSEQQQQQQQQQPAAPAAPVKNFPNIKIEATLTAEEIQAEMERAKVFFGTNEHDLLASKLCSD